MPFITSQLSSTSTPNCHLMLNQESTLKLLQDISHQKLDLEDIESDTSSRIPLDKSIDMINYNSLS